MTAFIAVMLFGTADAETLRVYGPGGPAPAMQEAAEDFSKRHGIEVDIVAGPTEKWIAQAKNDADMIYSGSEHMMADFVSALDGQLAHKDVLPLYMRPMALLVRPGNPKRIAGSTMCWSAI